MNDEAKLLPKKLRIKFYAFKYGLYSFILFMIFAFAFLLDKHIEAIFIFVTYCFIRYKFPTTFHHNNTYWCVFWSVFSFWLCIIAVLPIKYSVLSTIVVAIALCFILYKVQESADVKAELAKKNEFSIYTCSYDEFASRCLMCGVRNDRVPYVWDIIRSEMTFDQIAEKYCISPESARHDRYVFKKKLQKGVDKKQS